MEVNDTKSGADCFFQ